MKPGTQPDSCKTKIQAIMDIRKEGVHMADIVQGAGLEGSRKQDAGKDIQLKVELTPVINYALQQNRIPIVQDILICNNSASDIKNAVIQLRCEPELISPAQVNIDLVPAGSSFALSNFHPQANASFLAELSERIVGRVFITLEDEKEGILAEHTSEVTALAFDEWHGTAFFPELLSAFVTPNHPEIVKITARAAQLLGKWSGSPSLDAYQTQDPNRVLMQAAAVYGALQEANIVYSVPPASFERIGQRVRLCDAVIRQKMGTCLDLTLFYAACLESIGLHPILLLQQGHIFAGIWLEDLSFPESVENDPSLITKRIAEGVNEIAVVECTALVAGKNISFDDAMSAAISKLHDTNPLEYIIDVTRSRLSGIRPLPLRIQSETGWKIEMPERKENELTQIPGALSETIHVGDTVSEKTWSKMAQWERKLLDLSLRNTLINFRWTQNVIPLLSESLADLEDALAGGGEYGIGSRPAEWAASNDLYNSLENLTDLGIYRDLIKSEFQNKRLRSFLSEAELSHAVLNIYRSSKTSLEENGANTLYLALGFLRWYETPSSQKPRYAPLILLPVEIVRKSALKGYMIRLRDEEPQINVTLLQMIEQDFGIFVQGLDPLPQDAQGIDLRTVFAVMRKAVMDQPRWDIIQTAFLGIFSFSQFVMWNDLRNRSEDLQKNKIVRSLIDGCLAWEAQEMQPGEKVPEDDVLLPVPVDASQLYAIRAAAEGKSFVLHGPPGTGKSQTITAIIANALAKGQTVLFVAEKMAALSVVYQRLKTIGIGPFCLELHSNKSSKRSVLDQLQEAVQAANQGSSGTWLKKSEQTAELRKELNVYAQALHRKQKTGLSLFDMISEYVKYAESPDFIRFPSAFTDQVDEELMQKQQQMLERLIAAARLVGHPHNHPLHHVNRSVYTQQFRNELPEQITAYKASIQGLAGAGEVLAKRLDWPEPVLLSDWEKLYRISTQLNVWTSLPRYWGKDPNWERTSKEIQKMALHFSTARKLKDQLSPHWEEGFFTLDSAALKSEWTGSLAKWFAPKLIQQNKIIKGIRAFWKTTGRKIPKDSLLQTFTLLNDYQENMASAKELFKQYGEMLGALYNDDLTDWDGISVFAGDARTSDAELEALTGSDKLRIGFAGIKELSPVITDCIKAYERMQQAKTGLYTLLEITEDEPNGVSWISAQLSMCENIQAHSDDLKDWMIWTGHVKEASLLGMSPLISAYQDGLPHEKAVSAYHKGLYTALIQKTIEENPVLNSFSGVVFDEKIRQFRQLDQELIELAKKEAFYRLASQVPNLMQEASQKSEVGVLQRAIRSGGRGISIRRLFGQISNLLPRLCPCMLMSPISAAQYLDPNRKPFDLVIFDEASQMPTSRAVGALARGSNAVIVGDPKQMPPTSFFSGNYLDEDNLESEDLESVLDDALALNMPQSHLLWHYRSRHESLIAFSNNRFYENKLYTFPSVSDRESKVTLEQVGGVFDRGKLRQNRAEAEAIVKELIRRSQDPACRDQSVGVISFNIQQQNLIDDLFTEACKASPELEQWAYEAAEPMFIKNLENVQGDERDVILFSIGFGPDSTGKVYMNFGPINREGGWRRLNVAVSRARQEMKVFSSIQADQIDLSRTISEGVAALKAFLAYASGAALSENNQTLSKPEDLKNGIADTLKRKLEHSGYTAQLQVGRSKFKVDLAVVDPNDSNRYLLGILLDGSTYKASKTTRDREISQVAVLSGLGWRIHRLWTVDWWDNSEKEFNKILDLLKKPVLRPAPLSEKTASLSKDAAAYKVPQEKLANLHKDSNTLPAPEQLYENYQAASLPAVSFTPEEYLLPRNAGAIKKAIQAVLKTEAPISESLLTRRVVQSFGISRAGSRIQQRTAEILQSIPLTCTRQADQNFYWTASQNPDTYPGFRTSVSGVRDAGDIPVQELANAVCGILKKQIAMPKDELVRETANLLGYSRLGTNVISAVNTGIEYAVKKGRITEQTKDYFVL
jgi:hypothetical protein